MSVPNLKAITAELNQRARAHPIGRLQKIRSELHHRRPAGQNIFSLQTTFDDGAFHHGGATELQFNIWLEDGKLRHGVAFCFKRTQTLQKPIAVLSPKVRLFNNFMRLYPEIYGDMRMWHYSKGESPSSDYMPKPIPHKLVTKGVFLFLGKRQRIDRIDYEVILNDFDRLLPLYKFTEGRSEWQTVSVPIESGFRSGFLPNALSAIKMQSRKQLEVILRHNKLQKALYRRLISQYGAKNVTPEYPTIIGTSVDVAVHRGKAYWFYEIKTADSPRACLREALGQLLEYAFWPGSLMVTRLIVVGESTMDKKCEAYLQRLRDRFSLPVEYQQIVLR